MGVSETWSDGGTNMEEVFHTIGDHVNGEGWGWVRRVERLKVLPNHVGREGVQKDGASFGTGDGLFPQ